MKLLGIKVKQEIKETLSNSIHVNKSVSPEFVVSPYPGVIKNAPKHAAYLNDALKIISVNEADDNKVIINYKRSILKMSESEPRIADYRSDKELVGNAVKEVETIVYFELLFEEPEEEVEEVEEVETPVVKKKTLKEQRDECYEKQMYLEAFELTKKLIEIKQQDRCYREVFDFRLDLFDLTKELGMQYLDHKITEDMEHDLEEGTFDPREKMELIREIGNHYLKLNDYNNAEKCYRTALSMTDMDDKVEGILKQLYLVSLRRMYDMEAYIASFYYKGREKLAEISNEVRLPDDYLAHDPIESLPVFQNAVYDIDQKINDLLGEKARMRSDYNTLYWRKKAELLNQECSISWKSPDKLNSKNRL